MMRWIWGGLALALLVLSSGEAWAYNVSGKSCGGTHWLDRFRPPGGCQSDADCNSGFNSGLYCHPVTQWCERSYWIQDAGYSGMTFEQVERIFALGWEVWDAPCCSTWNIVYKGKDSASADSSSSKHILSFAESTWPSSFGDRNVTIGVTPFSYTGDCVIRSADILYNAVTFNFIDGSPQAQNDADLRSISVHEMGHFLGLDHSATQTTSMYPTYSNGIGERDLHQDDIDGVCFLYNQACNCVADAECAPGYRCDTGSGQCVEDVCTGDSDCQSPLICNTSSGQCEEPPCGSDTDCPAGQFCNGGVCAYTGCSVCQTCNQNAECGSNGLCVNFGTSENYCTALCSEGNSCPGDSTCFSITFGDGTQQDLCLNPDLASTSTYCTGYTCTELPDGCPTVGDACGSCGPNSDLCIDVGTESYCSCTCSQDSECGAGNTCDLLPSGTQACVVPCQGITCTSGNTCDPALNRCVPTNCVGVICPADEICDPNSGACVSTTGCPGLGDSCTTTSQCTLANDLCVDPDRSGSICTCSCEVDADCGNGNSCVDYGTKYCLPGNYAPNLSTSTKVGGLFFDADLNGVISPGDLVRYTIRLDNTGNDVATIPELRDTIPAQAASWTLWDDGGGNPARSTAGELIISNIRVDAFSWVEIIIDLEIKDVPDQTPLNNTATFDPPRQGGSGGILTAPALVIRRDQDEDGYFDNEDCGPTNENRYPGRLEQCDGQDNDCDAGTPDGFGEVWFGDSCDGDDFDLCHEGVVTCIGGQQACTDTTPNNVETCDGIDNDCNSNTADGAGETWIAQPCDGPDSDLCTEGSWSCEAGGQKTCSDTTQGNLELCDGADNDCDPSTPDGSAVAGFGEPCDGIDSDDCREGTATCNPSTFQIECDDTTNDSVEICDNQEDDDCDGVPDDGCSCNDGDTQSCYTGPGNTFLVAPCRAGTQTCSGSTWGPCVGQVLPQPDICDRANNDCDTSTPDGSAESWYGDPCDGDDADLCEEGTKFCDASISAEGCQEPLEDALEICDGTTDNDCDGEFEEGCACINGDTQPCYTGPEGTRNIGACSDGTQTCVDGAWGACSGDTLPTSELCDGLDNDCNPATADGAEETWFGDACDGADADLCEEGALECDGSGGQLCSDTTGDTAEVCDGVDNNCDGADDEGCDCVQGESTPCYGGPAGTENVGACKGGTQTCNAGVLSACQGQVLPTPEVCDGIDNDCDPTTEDGSGQCTSDQYCDGTRCQLDPGLCDTVTCNAGERCDPATGNCVMISVETDPDAGSDVGSDTAADTGTDTGTPGTDTVSPDDTGTGNDTGSTADIVELADDGTSKEDCACSSIQGPTPHRGSMPWLITLALAGIAVMRRRRR